MRKHAKRVLCLLAAALHCRRTAAYLPQKISAAYPPLVMYRRSFFISGRPISFLNLYNYNDFRPGNATPPGKILRQGQKNSCNLAYVTDESPAAG
mgnify:CR=1 FL=1